jgi:hypothetical protein
MKKKEITVQWVLNDPDDLYPMEMEVVKSTHPTYKVGSRFDFGFFQIATDAGYKIISLPCK